MIDDATNVAARGYKYDVLVDIAKPIVLDVDEQCAVMADENEIEYRVDKFWLNKRIEKRRVEERKHRELVRWANEMTDKAWDEIQPKLREMELLEKPEVKAYVAAEREWFLSGGQRRIAQLRQVRRTDNEEFELIELEQQKKAIIQTRRKLGLPFGFAQNLITTR
jgi:hypothetical protein